MYIKVSVAAISVGLSKNRQQITLSPFKDYKNSNDTELLFYILRYSCLVYLL